MSKQALDNVVSHWHKLVENFETSPKEFYASVEVALARRQIPGLKTQDVIYSEGGVLSARRQYLRVDGERHAFDICAAPYGSGFFFSSWMTTRKPRLVVFHLAVLLVGTMVAAWGMQALLRVVLQGLSNSPGYGLGFQLLLPLLQIVLGSFVLVPLALLIALWVVSLSAQSGFTDPEGAVLTVPGLGWFYRSVFAPDTYYRLDTMLMFQSAAHAATLEVVNGLLTQKGLRALGEAEQKPVFRELMLGGRPSAGADRGVPEAELVGAAS